MSLPRLKVKRYCDRAQECLETAAKAQTPGGSGIQLQLAEWYLFLAQAELKHAGEITENGRRAHGY